MIQRQVNTDFLNLFDHELMDVDLENGHRLNLFILKCRSNRFIYNDLCEQLAEAIIPFSLSRHTISDLKSSYGATAYRAAVSKLRDYFSNKGEAGEIMLYCLLDSHLGAPKLLSKLEIKTSNNIYVQGADGVHLLEVSPGKFQIIFGESKLNKTLSNSIREAFISCKNFVTNRNSKIDFERGLIDSQLLKEAVTDEAYQFIKGILFPSKASRPTIVDYSFGCFLGFDLLIEPRILNLTPDKFREHVRKAIKEQVVGSYEAIKEKLTSPELNGYQFYFYVVPFTDLDNTRKEIIRNLSMQ